MTTTPHALHVCPRSLTSCQHGVPRRMSVLASPLSQGGKETLHVRARYLTSLGEV